MDIPIEKCREINFSCISFRLCHVCVEIIAVVRSGISTTVFRAREKRPRVLWVISFRTAQQVSLSSRLLRKCTMLFETSRSVSASEIGRVQDFFETTKRRRWRTFHLGRKARAVESTSACLDTARASLDEPTSETCLKRMGPRKRPPRLRLKSPLDAHVQWLPITNYAGHRQFEPLLNLCPLVCCPGTDVTRQPPRQSEPTGENRKWN